MAFDVAQDMTGRGADIAAKGIGAVGIYLREDRCPASMVADLHANGIKIWSIWEKGYPTSAGYFTADQGTLDGTEAMEYALTLGQPSETTISPGVDYDSDPDDVKDYLMAFHNVIKTSGYYMLPYGNGVTLQWAVDAGYSVGGYLSQSTGFTGYDDFYHRAAIIQGVGTTILGMGVDLDIIAAEEVTAGGLTISLLW